jgi:hypothetical protein
MRMNSDASLIQRIAVQLDVSKSGELCAIVDSMLNASELPLAVHQLRLAYEERDVEQLEIRRELVALIETHRAALEQLFQCGYDF